jgi:hypothetical protein
MYVCDPGPAQHQQPTEHHEQHEQKVGYKD